MFGGRVKRAFGGGGDGAPLDGRAKVGNGGGDGDDGSVPSEPAGWPTGVGVGS